MFEFFSEFFLTESSNAKNIVMEMTFYAFVIRTKVWFWALRMLTFVFELETVVLAFLFAFEKGPVRFDPENFRMFDFDVWQIVH